MKCFSLMSLYRLTVLLANIRNKISLRTFRRTKHQADEAEKLCLSCEEQNNLAHSSAFSIEPLSSLCFNSEPRSRAPTTPH